jgi:hypothetical protein
VANSDLIAPCGMNCAICANYIVWKNNLKSKGIRMPACTGCRIREKQCAYIKKWCPNLRSGNANFCYQCADFPCHRLKKINARYRSRYHMSMIENLLFIKYYGMEAFLAWQKNRWHCPSCGGMISCHNGLCFKCDLEKLQAKNQKYRWEENEENKLLHHP